MNKEDIITTLKKYYLKDYIIISGASMVLQGIKEITNDIDITVSDDTYNYLLNIYNCEYEKNVDGSDVWFIDNIINFSNNYYKKIDYIVVDGLKIQTIESILKLKRSLNREKDKLDIKLLENFIQNKKCR